MGGSGLALQEKDAERSQAEHAVSQACGDGREGQAIWKALELVTS